MATAGASRGRQPDDDDPELSSHSSDDEVVITTHPGGTKSYKYCVDCGELRPYAYQYFSRAITPRGIATCHELSHTLLPQGATVSRGQRRRSMARAARTLKEDTAAAIERREAKAKPQPAGGGAQQQRQKAAVPSGIEHC